MLETTVIVLAVVGLGTIGYWLARLGRAIWKACRREEDWSVEDILEREG